MGTGDRAGDTAADTAREQDWEQDWEQGQEGKVRGKTWGRVGKGSGLGATGLRYAEPGGRARGGAGERAGRTGPEPPSPVSSDIIRVASSNSTAAALTIPCFPPSSRPTPASPSV